MLLAVGAGIRRSTRGLEIAHLVPHGLGGLMVAGNLVLLCEECHVDAPDYADPRYMLAWMLTRESFQARWYRNAEAEFREYPDLAAQPQRVLAALHDDAFRQWYTEHVVVHAGRMLSSGPCIATGLAILHGYLNR